MFANVPSVDGYTNLSDIEGASYQLLKGSPCIDTGDDNYAAISLYDLAGQSRLVGTHIDRGAYEFDEDATSIHNSLPATRNYIYNVGGLRLQKPQKGVNIVNGEKVLY